MRKPVEIFFSYSHRDEALRDELVKHLGVLKRQRIIEDWHYRRILAGQEWENEIDYHLDQAEVILLLVSADFIDSDYCYGIELKRAMQRYYSQTAYVIPIILRPVDWQDTPFSQLQALPRDAKPVTKWENQDEAFTHIAQEIRTVVGMLRSHPSEPPEPPIPPIPPFRISFSVKHTALAIAMLLLGWFLATWIGSAVSSSISRQLAIAGGVGGLINGLSIEMRLRLIKRSDSRNLLKSIVIWTACTAFWGMIVGQQVESSPAQLSLDNGVFSVVIPGIAAGILFLIWRLRKLRYT